MDSEPEKCNSLPEIANLNNDKLPFEEEKKGNEVNRSLDTLRKSDFKPKLPLPKGKKNKKRKLY